MTSIATTPGTASATPASVWAGRALSGLAVLALSADAAAKLFVPQLMIANTEPQLGMPTDVGFYRLLGAILAIGLALYLWPRTKVLGAILITGFLGGAVATHARVGDPLFSHTLFGVYLGVLVWAGLWLRDARVRALLS